MVSIIIPTYNSETHLNDCLASIESQSYSNIETIIIDNYSKDETKTIALSHSVKFIQHQGNVASARNLGIEKSRGRYILLLDADQIMSPHLIQFCVDSFSNQNVDALIIPEKSIGEGFWVRVLDFERSLVATEPAVAMPRFFKAGVLTTLGEDENLVFGEDWDLYLRFNQRGFKMNTIRAYIFHKEPEALSKILIKNLRYGSAFRMLTKKHGAKIYRRYTFLPISIKKFMKYFTESPYLGAGYTVLRFLRIIFFILGVAAGIVNNRTTDAS